MKNEDGSRDERVLAKCIWNYFEGPQAGHLGYNVLISNANFTSSPLYVPNCNDPQEYQIAFVRT